MNTTKSLIAIVKKVVDDERNKRPMNDWVVGVGSDFNKDTPIGCCLTFDHGNPNATLQAYLHFQGLGMQATPLIVTGNTKYLYLHRADKGMVYTRQL